MSAAPFRRRHTHYQPLMPSEPDLWAVARTERSRYADFVERNITPPSEPVDTSEAAAQAIQPAARTIRETVFDYVASQGDWGATCGELCEALDLNASTARPRLRELEGNASWCRGQLPARIVKTPTQRSGMRVYRTLA